jgi:hypothetical protein
MDIITQKKIEGNLLSIINTFTFSIDPNAQEIIYSFITHGEYGLAFELLLDVLEDNISKVDKNNINVLYEIIEETGLMMNFDKSLWSFLQKIGSL